MQFILENYLVIILVGMFFIFALIGYLIDLFRKNPKSNEENLNVETNIQPTSINNAMPEIVNDVNSVNNEIDKPNELLTGNKDNK